MPHGLHPSFGASAPEVYEKHFVPAIGAPIATDLLEAAALRPGERVLDVGCGTGIVARLAAEAVGTEGSVTGLDVEPGMLAVARSAAADSGIEWVEASAESIPLPDGSFDAVLCQMCLQFVPDREAALAEMRRVLAPGGRLVLNVPGPTSPFFAALSGAMAEHVDPAAAGMLEHVFSLHDADEIEGLLAGAGFREVEVDATEKALSLPPPREFLWQYVNGTPLAGVVGGADEETRAALEEEVVAGWRAYEGEDGMACRQRIVVASGRR